MAYLDQLLAHSQSNSHAWSWCTTASSNASAAGLIIPVTTQAPCCDLQSYSCFPAPANSQQHIQAVKTILKRRMTGLAGFPPRDRSAVTHSATLPIWSDAPVTAAAPVVAANALVTDLDNGGTALFAFATHARATGSAEAAGAAGAAGEAEAAIAAAAAAAAAADACCLTFRDIWDMLPIDIALQACAQLLCSSGHIKTRLSHATHASTAFFKPTATIRPIMAFSLLGDDSIKGVDGHPLQSAG